jgi:hypothetical protein
MIDLPGDSQPVEIAFGYHIRAPGLQGTAEKLSPIEDDYRDTAFRAAEFETAVEKAELSTAAVLELNVAETFVPESDDEMRAAHTGMVTREGEAAFEVVMPSRGDDVGYAALYTDEAGTSRWFFPERIETDLDPSRGDSSGVVFHLPRQGAKMSHSLEEEGERGPLARIGRRAVRLLTWATDPIIGAGMFAAAKMWENSRRPSAFVRIDSNGFDSEPDWTDLQKGRALLFLHGTFSTAASAFGELTEWEGFTDLLNRYGNRVFAFNHPTLHASPAENMEELCRMLPEKATLECDIVTHSRGGLVGRELIERVTENRLAGRKLTIRRAVFVAGPLDGTALADGKHMFAFIDRHTNLLTWLPDTAFTLTLEGVLAAVRLLAHGGLPGLPGLHSMLPNGPYLSALNPGTAGKTRYHAIAANFTPNDPNLLVRFAKSVGNNIVDKIFEQDNDGVVPTRGAFELATAGGAFPIPSKQRLVLDKKDQVHHLNFFSKPAVNKKIAEWLTSD